MSDEELLELLKPLGATEITERVRAPSSSWRRSRVVLCGDGTSTTVLRLLARFKWGEQAASQDVYWTDAKGTESVDNVSLGKAPRRSWTHSRYGVPSDTAEYQRLYRRDNPERARATQRRYHAKRKVLVEAAKAMMRVKQAEAPQKFEHLEQLLGRKHHS